MHSQPSWLRRGLGLVFGYGLFSVEGNVHKQMRKMLNRRFSIPVLKSRASVIIVQPSKIYARLN